MDIKNVEGLSKTTIEWIDPIFQPNPKKTFIKRVFCVRTVDTVNGNEYPNSLVIQALGQTDRPNEDKTKLLDGLNIGDMVDLSYGIKCQISVKDKKEPTEKNPGCFDGFLNLNLNSISLFKAGNVAPVPASEIEDKKKAWDKKQADLKNKDVPHEGMVWNESLGTWEDDLPF